MAAFLINNYCLGLTLPSLTSRLRKGLDFQEKLFKYKFLINSLFFLGISSSCFATSSQTFDSLIVELSKTHNDSTKIFLFLSLADHVIASDIKSLERYSMEALNLAKKTNNARGLAYAHFSLSRVYMYNEFDFAEELLIKSLKYAGQIKDSLLIAKAYNSIGALLLKDEDKKDMALEYYEKAVDILNRHKQDREIAALYSNIGMIYEKDTASISYFLKAAEINKEFENYLWLSINYLNTGITYLDLGDLEMSYNYLQESLALSEEYGFDNHLSTTYVALGEYYFEMENYITSISYTEQALKRAKQQNNRIDELDALILLSKNYKATKELEKALEYSELIKAANDSIHRHNRLNELAVLDMKNKFEQELEQEEIKRNLLENEYKNDRLVLFIIIVSVVLLLIIFILLFFYSRSRMTSNRLIEEKLSQELEFKNKELTTSVIYTIKKNDMLTSLSNELSDLKERVAKKDVREQVDQISKRIKASIEPDSWEEFEIRFQQVHLDFYKNLLQEFPNLTTNEKRLCAFLRLNMSSKEISKITGQSVSAIEMARVRLRKKLGISNKNINLITFLGQY